jgi:hypothetical protein
MSTKTVEVTTTVQGSLDESKFMQEFRDSFYGFHTIIDHYEHLAYMFAQWFCNNYSFIEGYGNPKDMGIRFEIVHSETKTL